MTATAEAPEEAAPVLALWARQDRRNWPGCCCSTRRPKYRSQYPARNTR